MGVFGITPLLKRENRQYWGRELGLCWQRLVCELLRVTNPNYLPGIKIGNDEPCDCQIGDDAIDTKYRIGSGDSGTLKKFRQYGQMFTEQRLRPILLILREDNLPAAIRACSAGGWEIYIGDRTFEYIHEKAQFDMKIWLSQIAASNEFKVER